MRIPTQFPIEWLFKKSREEVEELKKENSRIREENLELRQRVANFTCRNEAKIAVRKELLYQQLEAQRKEFQSKYNKVRQQLRQYEADKTQGGAAAPKA